MALSKGCPGLKKLHLSSPTITSEALLSVAEHCHQLEFINLTKCDDVHSRGMIALIEANPHLESITLDTCRHIDDEAVLAAARYCPELATFTVIGCQSITQRSLTQLIDICTSLETLKLDRLDITDAFVNTIVNICTRLKSIELCRCPNITERSLTTLLKSTGSLCSISIVSCSLLVSDKLRMYYTTVPSDSDQVPIVKLARRTRGSHWLPCNTAADTQL